MKRIEITINGEAYLCSPTMGAMLRFKQETGREITEMEEGSFGDLCTFLYCCVVSGAKREGREFKMSLMDFADAIDPEDMEAWNSAITTTKGESAEVSKKKRKRG